MTNSKSTQENSRRSFLKNTFLLATGFAVASKVNIANATSLVVDKKRVALQFLHFPSRVHTFIWRNWSLVSIEKMAQVLKTSQGNVKMIGYRMSLPDPTAISKEQWARSYITIIRRNWHLLPKEQLTELLGWTSEHLEFTLKEDDFLDVKLGHIKPECAPLLYDEISVTSKKQEIWLHNLVQDLKLAKPKEKLFQFVEDLSKPPKEKVTISSSGFSPRYGYGYFMLFGDPLLDAEIDPYPEGYLERMSAAGMDGTWMHIVLSKVTPFPWEPSQSDKWEKRLINLKKLVEKCKKQGIGIYLYLNEPRYQSLSFYEKYPDLKGVTRGDQASLCTSHPEVQQYLVDSIAHITSVVPDLAGFFSITASENPTNCWSHFEGHKCPRCSKRTPADVIGELNQLYQSGIEKGIKKYEEESGTKHAGAMPRLIAWDWGWRDDWAKGIVPLLPKSASLMSVSEWELPIERGGIKSKVGEYSISAIGPGPRAKRHWAIAREHNLRIIAKIQAGTTWELGAVPYVPAVKNVAQHAFNLRQEKVSGLMTGWTLGGYPGSPNLEVVAEIGVNESISVEEAMLKVAKRRYGKAADAVVKAWSNYSAAFSEFPYNISTVYTAPVHSGPANLLYAEPTGYAATMVGIGYDDLTAWRSIYPTEVFVQQLYKVADGFDETIASLKTELKKVKMNEVAKSELLKECDLAEAIAIHYRSVANQSQFITLRANAKEPSTKVELTKLVNDEIKLAKKLYSIQTKDSRIGFEATNHYFYIPADLVEKIINCRYLLEYVWK